jgi:hypothetical protein
MGAAYRPLNHEFLWREQGMDDRELVIYFVVGIGVDDDSDLAARRL